MHPLYQNINSNINNKNTFNKKKKNLSNNNQKSDNKIHDIFEKMINKLKEFLKVKNLEKEKNAKKYLFIYFLK